MKIQDDIKSVVKKRISTFNTQHNCQFVASFKGKFLYLDKADKLGTVTHIFRLTFSGDIESWEAAVYKYSRNTYDANEMFFPGMEHIDGTLEGAMLAGLKLYI
jgi:hypothetical protein